MDVSDHSLHWNVLGTTLKVPSADLTHNLFQYFVDLAKRQCCGELQISDKAVQSCGNKICKMKLYYKNFISSASNHYRCRTCYKLCRFSTIDTIAIDADAINTAAIVTMLSAIRLL